MARLTPFLGPGIVLLYLLALNGTRAAKPEPQPTDQLARCWQDLAATDAAQAYRGIWLIANSPHEGVKLMRQQLAPASPPDERLIKAWIGDLTSDKFAIRDKAFKELEKQGELAEDSLRKALLAAPDLETKRRIESLLKRLQATVASQENVRLIRAVEALELVGTADAIELLDKLAGGYSKHRLTIEAKESAERLRKRSAFSSDRIGIAFKSAPTERTPLPRGARMRLGTTTFRQNEFLSSRQPSFSSDSKLLACPGSDSVYLWETQTGKLQGVLDYKAVRLAFSPKDSFLALGIASTKEKAGVVLLRNMAEGRDVGRFELPFEVSPQELSFNLDGSQLNVKNSDNSLRVLALPSLKVIRDWKPDDLKGKKGGVLKVLAFSPDGKHVVTQQALAAVSLFDLTNSSSKPLQGFQSSGDQARFSPDGTLLATLNPSNAGLRIWDVASGQPKWIQKEVHRYSEPMVFSPNGKLFAAAAQSRKDICLWNTQTGEFLNRLAGSEEFQIGTISPDSTWLAGVAGKTIRIWNLTTGQAIPDGGGHVHAIEQMAFLPNMHSIVTSTGDGTFLFWDTETGKQKGQLKTDGRNLPGVAFSSDGRLLVTSDMEGFVGLWNVATGKHLLSLPGHGRTGSLQRPVHIATDGSYFLTWSSNDFYLRKWDTQTGKCLLEHRTRPTGFAIPDDAGKDSPKPAALGLEGAIFTTGSVFSPDAEQLILASRNGNLHFFDIATGAETRVCNIGAEAYNLIVSPARSHVAFRDLRRLQTHVLGLASGKAVFTLSSDHPPGQAVFSADGRTIAVPCGDKLLLTEVSTGKTRMIVEKLPTMSDRLKFSPDGRMLISAMDDTSALVWDLAVLAGVSSIKPNSENH